MVFPKDNRMPREKELIVSFSKFHNSLCMCITQYQVLQIPELLNKIHNHCFSDTLQKKKICLKIQMEANLEERDVYRRRKERKIILREITNRHKEPPSLY